MQTKPANDNAVVTTNRLEEAERDITKLHQERERWIKYTIDLQRIIEALCARRILAKPVSTARHHHNMASEYLADQKLAVHPDDLAVDRFASAMKAKLRWEREERNRCGWQERSAANLSRLLIEHLPKGDPIDVANFCMMLSLNGHQIIVDQGEGGCV